jgi:hypothetical protein
VLRSLWREGRWKRERCKPREKALMSSAAICGQKLEMKEAMRQLLPFHAHNNDELILALNHFIQLAEKAHAGI